MGWLMVTMVTLNEMLMVMVKYSCSLVECTQRKGIVGHFWKSPDLMNGVGRRVGGRSR